MLEKTEKNMIKHDKRLVIHSKAKKKTWKKALHHKYEIKNTKIKIWFIERGPLSFLPFMGTSNSSKKKNLKPTME